MVAGGACVVCSEENTSLSCTTCTMASYCSTTCQVKDTNNEHHQCLPYTILHESRCGRLLMASRDISAGEVLFNDIPGAVGPDNNPKPVCLTCYKRLPGLVYRCRHCSWPLCSPFCQQEDGPHARECQLFQKHSPRSAILHLQTFVNQASITDLISRILQSHVHGITQLWFSAYCGLKRTNQTHGNFWICSWITLKKKK